MQLSDIAETFDKPLEYIKSIMSDLRDTFEEESNARGTIDTATSTENTLQITKGSVLTGNIDASANLLFF